MGIDDFQLIDDPNEAYGLVNGTSLQSYIAVKPVALLWVFGKPLPSDGYKVSGEYIFKHRSGEVITLYDWKHTTLYEDGIIEPNKFWTSPSNYVFHIGAKGMEYINDFQDWLLSEIERIYG